MSLLPSILYLDRWSVEQVPLVTKQLLGLERQFVFAPASRRLLPELALLVANILAYLAAGIAPIAHRLLGPATETHSRAAAPGAGSD
jgi:hypothetical protein